MKKFYLKDCFVMKGSNLIVIVGKVIEGSINKGNKLILDVENQIEIKSIGELDGMVEGEFISYTTLTIENLNIDLIENKLNKIIYIK